MCKFFEILKFEKGDLRWALEVQMLVLSGHHVLYAECGEVKREYGASYASPLPPLRGRHAFADFGKGDGALPGNHDE